MRGVQRRLAYRSTQVAHVKVRRILVKVGRTRVQDRLGRGAVTPRAPDLLVVLFHRLGGPVVQDASRVGLVNAHAKCYRGDQDGPLPGQKGGMRVRPGRCGQTRVVGPHNHGRIVDVELQQTGQLIDLVPRGHVDNRAFLRRTHRGRIPTLKVGLQGTQRIRGAGMDREAQIFAIQGLLGHDWVVELQDGRNIGLDAWHGRRGQRQERNGAQDGMLTKRVKFAKVGTKVGPPFRDGMRFVNGNQTNALVLLMKCCKAIEGGDQLFRREIDERKGAPKGLHFHVAIRLRGSQKGRHRRSGRQGIEFVALILHEGN